MKLIHRRLVRRAGRVAASIGCAHNLWTTLCARPRRTGQLFDSKGNFPPAQVWSTTPAWRGDLAWHLVIQRRSGGVCLPHVVGKAIATICFQPPLGISRPPAAAPIKLSPQTVENFVSKRHANALSPCFQTLFFHWANNVQHLAADRSRACHPSCRWRRPPARAHRSSWPAVPGSIPGKFCTSSVDNIVRKSQASSAST